MCFLNSHIPLGCVCEILCDRPRSSLWSCWDRLHKCHIKGDDDDAGVDYNNDDDDGDDDDDYHNDNDNDNDEHRKQSRQGPTRTSSPPHRSSTPRKRFISPLLMMLITHTVDFPQSGSIYLLMSCKAALPPNVQYRIRHHVTVTSRKQQQNFWGFFRKFGPIAYINTRKAIIIKRRILSTKRRPLSTKRGPISYIPP